MKSKKFWIFTVVVVVIIALVVVVLIRGGESSAAPETGTEEPTSIPIRVDEASEMTLAQRQTYSGTLDAWERIQIQGQSGQRIERIHVREGDRVRRGQLVAEMDDTNLRQAEVELRTARNELARMQRLVEIGSVARQQLEQAEAHFETASTNVDALRKNIRLTSPIAGMVTDLYFVPGELFVAGAEAPSIMTIQQVNPLKVIIDVSERNFSRIKPEMEATIVLDSYGEREFRGHVERINPTVSVESRTFRVEVQVDNEEGLLSPGMSARVALELGELSGRFVPRSALRTLPGNADPYVFIVDDDGESVRRVELTAGERVGEYRKIVDGLPDGAQVVVEGVGRLSDGSRVRIVD